MKGKSRLDGGTLLGLLLVACSLSAWAESESGAWQVTRDIYYGDPEARDRNYQSLDIYWWDDRKRRPVIIYVHGGGWAFGDKADVQEKPAYFLGQGMALVSMNYRLRWNYKVEHQAEDIASVVDWVRKNAGSYGFDPSRIILMGHAAGAHLVSLVGTDETYLKQKGMSLADLKAVVAIDTESYDIPRLMDELGTFVQKRHHRVIFGDDRESWIAKSPITHVEAGKKFPAFAILYLPENEPSTVQAKAFAKQLSKAGSEIILIPGNEKTRETIDEELGREGDTPTQALITFIHAKI